MRRGRRSKDFTPGMADAVFTNLLKDSPLQSFSVGIHDDVPRGRLRLTGSDGFFRRILYDGSRSVQYV